MNCYTKRNIEEEIIQNNIQKDEILSQIDVLSLEKQKILEFNRINEGTANTKNKN